jgi:integrase
MRAGVPGIRQKYFPERAATGQLSWAVLTDVQILGERFSPSSFWETEAEADIAFDTAVGVLAKVRAEAKLRKAAGEKCQTPLPAAPKNTELFETMALRWLEQTIKPPRKKASTYYSYRTVLRNHLLPIMRTWPVTDDVMTVQRLTEVLGPTLHAKGLGIQHRLGVQRVLSVFFGWALKQLPAKVLSRNPVTRLGLDLRQDDEFAIDLDKEPNPMTRVQLEAFLAWQKEHQDPTLYRLFLWLAYHGSRLGEALALQWDRLDFDREQGHVLETYSGAQRWIEIQSEKTSAHKGQEGRGLQPTKTRQAKQFINLHPLVCAELAAQKAENLQAWMKRGAHGTKPTFCFLNATNSDPLRPSARIYDAFRDGCTALGLVGDTGRPFTIHALRATFITLAILDGQPIGWVARMVGHKGETTITKHYYRWIQLAGDNPFRRERQR